ncbi:hypothetical protein TpMuguga_03g02385 [Theileria parva strain Muguga]|uniref:uncharacterized protein n=1 Tax=Theileria parva strain Muguga TaxID=333668 RepID=UPI001C6233DA|nr:uncharacterized protein TpMuguga_03g02385 [Theileria parva strain Muguga]KAF5153162.1 hypothetical protein TpMuguga_03g02385 [Theileria parva strain Muguga]
MDFIYLLYRENYFISNINFNNGENGLTLPESDEFPYVLGNEDCLDEKFVIKGFSKLAQIKENDSQSLLKNDIHISKIPQLQHNLILSNKYLIEDYYYYYSLENGIVIFGLNLTHSLIKEISGNNVKITFNELMCKNIRVESRTKRKKIENQILEEICKLEIGATKFIVKLPEKLLNFEVVELNTRLENEPELVDTEEGWIALLLDKNNKTPEILSKSHHE